MIKISRQQQMEMRRQVSPWMAARKLPLVLYDKLKPHNKVLLHNRVCVGTQGHRDEELLDLYVDLGLSEARAEKGADRQARKPTYKELDEYFSPQTPVGNVPYQRMY